VTVSQLDTDPFKPPPKRISQVVMAGGSSTLPALHDLVKRITSLQQLKCSVDPKLCVALGAAVFAGMLEGSIGNVELMDGAYSQRLHDRASGFQSQ